MDAALETKLIECLSALEAGESIERILSRYPNEATRLRPMLETAAALPALRMEPSSGAKSASRKTFLAQAAMLRDSTKPHRVSIFSRPLMTLASLALTLVIVAGGVVATSASALPGDPLYSVKRAVESARLSLASGAAGRDALAAQFEQERIREIGALLDAGREAEVKFAGVIQSIQSDVWLVADLVVHVNDSTRVDGRPQIGLRAQVEGRTLDGMLIAMAIVVEPGGEAESTPTPQPEPTSTYTPTPQVASASTPTSTPTPTPTSTPTRAPTPFEVEFVGLVEQADAQTWTIGGVVVEVNAATEFVDNPAIGQQARVRALDVGGGRLIGLRIERLGDDGNANDNGGNGNDNGDDNRNENNDNGNSNNNDDDNQNVNTNDNENHNDNTNENHNDNGNDNGGNSNSNSNG